MHEYARQRGLRRCLIPVPVLTPYLSSLWLGLTTPLYARVGRKLSRACATRPSCADDRRARGVPRSSPMGLRRAARARPPHEDREFAATRWNDALSATFVPPTSAACASAHGSSTRAPSPSPVPPAAAFAPDSPHRRPRPAGTTATAVAAARSSLDVLVGGVGLRRGRRDPERLAVGDALDFWRVVELRAATAACAWRRDAPARPGVARSSRWRPLRRFDHPPDRDLRSRRALRPPYWYGIYPFHARVFRGMSARSRRRRWRGTTWEAASPPGIPQLGTV